MPHALLASHADRSPSSSSSSYSSTDPPQGTSTEQYLPVQHQQGATASSPGQIPGATEGEAFYHARLHSYASDFDEYRDEDMSTVPVTKRMGTRAAFSPWKNEQQTNTTQLPSHLSSPGKHPGTGTGHTTRSANHSPPHSAMSPSKQLSSSSPDVAAKKKSASSRTLSPQTAPTSQASAPRRGIVDASSYHDSIRSRVSSPPLQVVPASSLKPLRRCSPPGNYGTKTPLTETTATTMERTPLSPEPADSTYTSHAAAPTHPLVPSTVPWQLSAPQERKRRSDDQVGEGGAIFAYASEAVSTLEQQYTDAIQRLQTMYRLYSRLEAHNCTLEREMQRMRKVEDVLRSHITFHLHSSVRQLKHEMKILKQYILLMNSNFGNQLKVLSQAHSEELLRLLGRHYTYTPLQSSGARGWHQPMQARVSIGVPGAGAASLEREAKGYCSSHSSQPITGDGSAVAAGAQTCSPEHWWNATDSRSGGMTEAWPALSPDHLLPRREKSDDENGVAESWGEGALVSGHHTYRQLQTALAAAQKRAIELEEMCSARQEEYESRIRQLKIAHRAKETTLTEELTLLRRRAEHVHPIDLQQATSQRGSTGETSVSMMPEYVNQLGQLLLELQRQQPTPKQEPNAPSTASTLASMLEVALQAGGKEGNFPLHRLEKTSEAVRRADSQHDDRSIPTASNNYMHGPRRVHGKGGGGGLNMPHRYSPAATAHLRERAREVLSDEPRKQGQRTDHGGSGSPQLRKKTPAGVAAPAASTTKGPLAYDRLVNHSRSPPHLSNFREHADKAGHFVARVRSCVPRGADGRSKPRRTSSSHEQGSGRAMSDTRHNATADHRAPTSLLGRAAHVGVRGDSSNAVTAPGNVQYGPSEIDIDVDRVAQGMWAKELLEERSHL